MVSFELLGTSDDETRILCESSSGYSVALVGHPTLAPVPDGEVKYDVIVKLNDISVEHGFRIDEVPSSISPEALAAALATAYANTRAQSAPSVREIPSAHLPTGAVGGARAQYRLRGAGSAIERVWVATKPSPAGVWALYHTTRSSLDHVNPIRWSHLLSTMNGQHRWGGDAPTRESVWPASEIALAQAKLDLNEAGGNEAVAKARELAYCGVGDDMITFFSQLTQTDDPPATSLDASRIDTIRTQVSTRLDPLLANIFVRNLDRCRTTLDLRAWAWQCVWAIGNASR